MSMFSKNTIVGATFLYSANNEVSALQMKAGISPEEFLADTSYYGELQRLKECRDVLPSESVAIEQRIDHVIEARLKALGRKLCYTFDVEQRKKLEKQRELTLLDSTTKNHHKFVEEWQKRLEGLETRRAECQKILQILGVKFQSKNQLKRVVKPDSSFSQQQKKEAKKMLEIYAESDEFVKEVDPAMANLTTIWNIFTDSCFPDSKRLLLEEWQKMPGNSDSLKQLLRDWEKMDKKMKNLKVNGNRDGMGRAKYHLRMVNDSVEALLTKIRSYSNQKKVA